jgi:hypothetical protein
MEGRMLSLEWHQSLEKGVWLAHEDEVYEIRMDVAHYRREGYLSWIEESENAFDKVLDSFKIRSAPPQPSPLPWVTLIGMVMILTAGVALAIALIRRAKAKKLSDERRQALHNKIDAIERKLERIRERLAEGKNVEDQLKSS